jgi:hypothetical protein
MAVRLQFARDIASEVDAGQGLKNITVRKIRTVSADLFRDPIFQSVCICTRCQLDIGGMVAASPALQGSCAGDLFQAFERGQEIETEMGV